ncbi:hypothetical protein OZX69_02625 [Lactobacillus sp. ESL0731]|uniref:type II restriction enzyme n=1 Tax=unclassified Lactobacillus TaxID=2620435 RepID=UPI0023F7751C|nr:MULTISPECIES: hypothetical protein [unclassified Lactobacillus]WEV51606.1 hypothetical protein OZX63_02625 [Lactobacillus sp. ESL0700]WEV62735.1 hypothetical protein OZX69_02625 [Lactobacillus sp. ESL0731]
MTRNDKAWENIFNIFQLNNKFKNTQVYKISADELKKYSHEEPRLMTKFDWSKARPQIFKDNNISRLPDSRGTYVLGKFKAYKKLDVNDIKPIKVKLPSWIKSFNGINITSEQMALNVAQATGMIDKVLNELSLISKPEPVSTITGRKSSGKFNYSIDLYDNSKYDFQVNNSQMEIDGAFEGLNSLMLIEAKSKIPQDFLIRQLYYPYRFYYNLNLNKCIIPVYFTYTDDIYTFHIFKFDDESNYSSIYKIKQISFIVDNDKGISVEDVKEISAKSTNKTKKAIFPQANNFALMIKILNFLKKPQTKVQIAKECAFDPRQGDYYANALIYLGLAEKEKVQGKFNFKLSKLGKYVISLDSLNKRNRIIIKQVLSQKTFNDIFKYIIKNDLRIHSKVVKNILLTNETSINGDTINRRYSTAISWMKWIFDRMNTEKELIIES